MKIKKLKGMMKGRKDYKCYVCKKNIPKGSYFFSEGSDYVKFCLNCQKDVRFPQRIANLNKIMKKTKEDIKMLNKNMEKYVRVNILAKLENG